jgi:hypothetical protein
MRRENHAVAWDLDQHAACGIVGLEPEMMSSSRKGKLCMLKTVTQNRRLNGGGGEGGAKGTGAVT